MAQTVTEKTINEIDFPEKYQLPDPTLTSNAREVLKRRYLKKNENGNPIETPKDMFWRVARVIAMEDRKYGATDDEIIKTAEDFYWMMSQGYWEPNSPTLMNAGRPLGQLSACFVLPVSDTMSNGKDGIYDTLTNMALIHQSGGGTGFSFSRLRPNGSIVKTTTGVASGPVSFMKLYDASTNVVKQGGTRRGANMGILRVDHPDIMEFIHCKADTSEVTNFNISVAVTDAFMSAVENEEKYDLIDPRDGSVVGSLDATEVFNEIVEQAWSTGEPGLFFIDEANRYNPVPHLGDYESTNPCGEQSLLPYDVCNLGSLNLSKFIVDDQFAFTYESRVEGTTIDWNEMKKYVHLSMKFLDNVIDANMYPLDEIEERAKSIRRVGNGVMGLADLLISLGIPYDSGDAWSLCAKVAEFFQTECHNASEKLAEERGVFPEWEDSVWGPEYEEWPTRRMRHCNTNTVAPTGTISIIAGCSGGIEPIFAVAFMRNQAGTTMPDVHPEVENYLKSKAPSDWREQLSKAGHIDFDWMQPRAKEVFRTANDIHPEDHIHMQAVWQRYIDNAISKTINFAKEATVEDVRCAYMLAYELNCKGITVYRDGSRPGQVLSTGKTEQADQDEAPSTRGSWDRPDVMTGETHRIDSPLGRMYVTVNSDSNNDPREVFVGVGKAGGEATANAEAIGRLLSTSLQWDVPVSELYHQLSGISSERAMGFGDYKVRSGPDAVAQVLRRYVNGNAVRPNKGAGTEIAACPDCGSQLRFSEGCLKCQSCGYSQCG